MVIDQNSSILQDMKKQLGYGDDYTIYDRDLILHINNVFMKLFERFGIGHRGFRITGTDETWGDFLPFNQYYVLDSTAEYVYMEVKKLFDPDSLAGSVLNSWNEVIKELEFTLMIAADTF